MSENPEECPECPKCGQGLYRECTENDIVYFQCDYCGDME